MSETTEVRNALQEQVAQLIDDAGAQPSDSSLNKKSPDEPKELPTKQEAPAPVRRSPFAFAMFKKSPKVRASADRTQMLGELLDAARTWVEGQAADAKAHWRDAARMSRESHSYGLMEEQAHLVVKDVASFLSGKESFGDEPSDGPWSDDEKARVVRSSAIYYAAAVWSDESAPDVEVWRALWFLLGTRAARIMQVEPRGCESVKILHWLWLEFSNAFLGAPTSDGRAIENSGLLGVSGSVVTLIRDESGSYRCSVDAARKQATVHSLSEFYKAPSEGVLVIPVRSVYFREQEKLLGGGLLVVEITGTERENLSVRVVGDVVDSTMFATFEHALYMKDVPLPVQFSRLSDGFAEVLRGGAQLASVTFPFSVLEMKNLNETRVELDHREETDKFVALCRVARTLRRAISVELRISSKAKPVSGVKRAAERGPRHHEEYGGKPEPQKASEKVKREATDDLKAALVNASTKFRLPIIQEVAEFFSRKLRGATLASFPPVFYFDGKSFKDVSCVLVRRTDKGKEEVYAFPPHLAELFSGKYDGLILTKIAAYARWLSKEKRESKQASGEEETRVPEQHAAGEDQPQAGGSEIAEPLPAQTETASESSKFPVETTAEEEAPMQTLPKAERPKKEPQQYEARWASPQARILAEEHGINISELVTFAPQGKKVTKADVERLIGVRE